MVLASERTRYHEALGVTRSGARSTGQGSRRGWCPTAAFRGPNEPYSLCGFGVSGGAEKADLVSAAVGPSTGDFTRVSSRDCFLRICNVWLKMRDADVLKEDRCLWPLTRTLSAGAGRSRHYGLVDEATGFQDVRAKDALARILERSWRRRFSRILNFSHRFLQGTLSTAGRRIPRRHAASAVLRQAGQQSGLLSASSPGVLAELQRKNPVTENGRRKGKNYKWLYAYGGPSETAAMLLG